MVLAKYIGGQCNSMGEHDINNSRSDDLNNCNDGINDDDSENDDDDRCCDEDLFLKNLSLFYLKLNSKYHMPASTIQMVDRRNAICA